MIRWNWRPTKVAFVDLETQSTFDIKDGGRRYADHPHTRICVATVLVDDWLGVWVPRSVLPDNASVHDVRPDGFDGAVETFDHNALPATIREKLEGRTLVGHNAFGFDARVWDRCVGDGFEWFDTLPCARAAGLPGGLNELGERLLGWGKDPYGKQLINLLSKAKIKDGRPLYAKGTEQVWRLFARYCARDTLLTAVVYEASARWVEPDFMRVHCQIAERGVPIDPVYCAQLFATIKEHELKAKGRFKELADVENPNSVPQVQAWLREQGFHVPSLERKELEEFFKDPEAFARDCEDPNVALVVEALRLRQSFARVGAGKVTAALTCADADFRIRDRIAPYGAHTGRFTSYDIQLHNMSRGADEVKPENCMPPTLQLVEAEAERATKQRIEKDPNNKKPVSVGDVFASMIRCMFAHQDGVSWSDYAGIESRGAGWFANDQKMLRMFADPKNDPYLDLGEIIYGKRPTKDSRERWVAKQAVLGAMYQLSGPGLEARCLQDGINLHDAHTTGKEVIGAYRRTYHMIPVMWNEYHEAIHAAVSRGVRSDRCRCSFYMSAGTLHVKLPSGRTLRYHNARIEDRVPGWAKYTGDKLTVPTVVFDLPRGWTGILYGGRMTENIVQAGMRDMLVDALIKCEDAGLLPIFHVHDEIVCQTRDLVKLCKIMSVPPAWAKGFPLLVEGAGNAWYAKKAPRGAPTCTAFCGEVLHGG